MHERRPWLPTRSDAVLAGALAFTLTACAGSDSQTTPEAAVRALIDAGNRRDVDAMRAVAISPERLGRAITCPTDDHHVDRIEAVASAYETMNERTGMSVRLISITQVARREVAVGDDYDGCRATEPFEIRRLRIELSADDGGGRRERSDDGDAIRLDNRWWLVLPSPHVP